MPDMLAELFKKQLKIQTLAYGKNPLDITDPIERIQFIKDMELAARMELGEMLDETDWKPWATSNHVNEEAGQGELADVLLFFINLCFAFRADAQDIFIKTMEKMDRNLARQLEGYDGIKGKCYICKRALDDIAVDCTEFDEPTLPYDGWCGMDNGNGQANGYFHKKAAIDVQ